MRRFSEPMTLLRFSGVLGVGLFLAVNVVSAQPPGGRSDETPREGRPGGDGRGPGGPGGRGGFGRGGFGFGFGGEPSLSRELRREAFSQKINLTEEQKQLLNDLDMQRSEYFRSLPRGGPPPVGEEFEKRMQDMQAKMKEFEGKAVEVLTPEQKAIWEERKAEVKAEQAAAEAARGERPDAGRPRGDGTPPAGPPQPPPRRTVFTDDKAPEGAKPTASFATRAPGGSAEGGSAAGGSPVGDADSKPANGAEPTLSFNFRYAPWADVLKLFAEAAGLTLDLNDVPPGTFNYYDDKTYTVTEALDVLNGYLLPKGFVLIRRDRFLVSLNIDNGIPPSLLPTITVDELAKRGANELLIVDVPLEGFEADKIVGEVKELLGPWGKVAAMKNTNSLNITDTGSNISRIIRLLKAGAPVDNKETSFRSLPLKHISAAEAERTVRRLFGLNPVVGTSVQQQQQFGFTPFGGFPQFGGFGGFRGGDDRSRGGDDRSRGGDPQRSTAIVNPASPSTPSPFAGKIQITADTRTNHLLITASSSLVKVVEDVVKSIDVDKNADGSAIVATNTGPAFLKAYTVAGGDVTQIGQTLNSIMPGLIVGQDARSGKLHVQATREEHAEIERLIQSLAGEVGGSVAVINLTRTDPIQVTNTLRNLFATEVKAPTIEADALGRRLLVRGTAEQLAQVKRLLQDLGEAGTNPQDDSVKVDRGPVRSLPLQGRNPEDVLPLMRKMWEAADRNPIRVVVPSQSSPIRERRVPAGRNLDSQTPADQNSRDSRPAGDARPTSRKITVPERTGPSVQLPRQPNSEGHATVDDSGSTSTPAQPQRRSILQVSQSGEGRDGRGGVSVPKTLETSRTDEGDDQPAKSSDAQDDSKSNVETSGTPSNQPPISMSIVGGDVIITSQDKEALDQLEDMWNSLVSALPNRTRWTIFYLRSADATDTAQMLERLFPQSSVTASTSASGGMFGQLTSGLSSLGRGLASNTGLGQTLGGANDLRIITDIRSNALFVTGPQDQIAEVESMLELLDSAELPESLRDRVPRSIPVEYAEVDDVADLVESVFKDSMSPDNAQAQQGGQRFNPLAMLMGGGGGGNGSKDAGVKLTIGVDRRTSHLIVACNDSLFRQIEGLVKSVDDRARDARQTVQIMHLATADPSLVSSTLSTLMPKVTITATRSGSRKKQPGQADQTPGQPGAQPPDAVRDPEMIRRAAEQRSRGQSSFGGGRTGGGRPSGGSGFGGGVRPGGGSGFGGGGRGGRGD